METIDLNAMTVQVFLAVLTVVVAVLGKMARQWLSTSLTSKQQDVLEMFAVTAVQAAEQLGYAGAVADKWQYAVDTVVEQMGKAGIKVAPETIVATIESAVATEFNAYKLRTAESAPPAVEEEPAPPEIVPPAPVD
jgi:D-alanyl-D-alanine carboxypeptidase